MSFIPVKSIEVVLGYHDLAIGGLRDESLHPSEPMMPLGRSGIRILKGSWAVVPEGR